MERILDMGSMTEHYFASADPWAMFVGIIVFVVASGLFGSALYGVYRLFHGKK